MTEDRPAPDALLRAVAAALRHRLPDGPAGQERLGLLLNAIGIAERALAGGEGVTRIRARLAAAGGTADPAALAAEIRAGTFDDGASAAPLHDALAEEARARLAISNPRYLEGWLGERNA